LKSIKKFSKTKAKRISSVCIFFTLFSMITRYFWFDRWIVGEGFLTLILRLGWISLPTMAMLFALIVNLFWTEPEKPMQDEQKQD